MRPSTLSFAVPNLTLMIRRTLAVLLLLMATMQFVPARAAYGVNLLSSTTFASGSNSWGYSDMSNCLNGYPNVGEANPNSITTSTVATENLMNVLNTNASVYSFTLTVTGNAIYDGEYKIRMYDLFGNETSTGLVPITAGTTKSVTLRFYPKSLGLPITLSISGRNTSAVAGCTGPIFSSPELIETAPPPKLSNTWTGSIDRYFGTATSTNFALYNKAIQSCAIAYSYLLYTSDPYGALVLHRTMRLTPDEVSGGKHYFVSGLKPRTSYFVKLIAHGDLVNCLDSDLPGVWPGWRTSGPGILATPAAPTLTNNSDNSINVSLVEAVPSATNYLFSLYASDGKTIVASQLVSTGIVGGSAIIAGLKYGETYYGGLVAKANGITAESSARSLLSPITIPANPGSVFSDSQCELNPTTPNAVVKISTSAGYCIARIETSTSITIPAGISKMDVLVVGGGGGGGAWVGGGGGGGGVVTSLNHSVTGSISATIGNGGIGGFYTAALGSVPGTAGGSSSFGALTALGGGYGANWSVYAQGASALDSTIANGGGGSGAAHASGGMGSLRTGGSGIISGLAPHPAGGGAGAGGNGGSAALGDLNAIGDRYCLAYGGNGGNGMRDSNGISGSTSNYFAGGGGGGVHGYNIENSYLDYCAGIAGVGGLGGGGDGLTPESNPYGPQTGYAGKVNTGGGGGGVGHANSNATYGGRGGSGVIYLRWSKTTSGLQSVAVSPPVSTTSYQSRINLTANLIGADAKVTFYQNGKRIPGCIGLRSSSLSVVCNWKVNVRNSVTITAIATQTTGNLTITSAPSVVTVGRRTTLR